MPKKIFIVELPDIENEIVGELDESTKIAFLAGFRQCLDTLQSKSVKVDVGKFSYLTLPDGMQLRHRLTEDEIIAIKQALESGDLFEEGK